MKRKNYIMYCNSNKMVMRIWSKTVMIKRVYEGGITLGFKYQSLTGRDKIFFSDYRNKLPYVATHPRNFLPDFPMSSQPI